MSEGVRQVRQCPACGNAMRPSDRFCTRCGHEAGRVPADPGSSGIRWSPRR